MKLLAIFLALFGGCLCTGCGLDKLLAEKRPQREQYNFVFLQPCEDWRRDGKVCVHVRSRESNIHAHEWSVAVSGGLAIVSESHNEQKPPEDPDGGTTLGTVWVQGMGEIELVNVRTWYKHRGALKEHVVTAMMPAWIQT